MSKHNRKMAILQIAQDATLEEVRFAQQMFGARLRELNGVAFSPWQQPTLPTATGKDVCKFCGSQPRDHRLIGDMPFHDFVSEDLEQHRAHLRDLETLFDEDVVRIYEGMTRNLALGEGSELQRGLEEAVVRERERLDGPDDDSEEPAGQGRYSKP